MSEPKPSIRIRPGGPYLVTNLTRLVDASGAERETEPTMALCRCGRSADKPFCDGAHKAAGFTGETRQDVTHQRRKDYAGRDVVVHYNLSICAHVGECTGALPEVFDVTRRPWIQPDGAAADAVGRTVHACPSGALAITRDGVETPGDDTDPGVTVRPNGPLAVTGVELPDVAWGDGASHTRYTLCRCGGSAVMPFCDGSHTKVGFRDPD